MSVQEFDAFLAKRVKEVEKEKKVDWINIHDEWVHQVDDFFEMVRKFLQKYVDDGKVVIRDEELTICEEHLGIYKTKKLYVQVVGEEVVFTPIGRLIIGGYGRIDMEGRSGKVKFILIEEDVEGFKTSSRISVGGIKPGEGIAGKKRHAITWKIVTPPPVIQFVKITPDSFYEVLMGVIGG